MDGAADGSWVGAWGYVEEKRDPRAWPDLLPHIFWTDHTRTGELHEQQQVGGCVWLQAPEPGSGKMVGSTGPGSLWGRGHGGRMFTSLTSSPAPISQLLDTKSTDRKMTLLHFIALTVKEKYPDLANFWHELHFVEKAAAGEGSLAGRVCLHVQPRTISGSYEQREHLGLFISGFCYRLSNYFKAFHWGHGQGLP